MEVVDCCRDNRTIKASLNQLIYSMRRFNFFYLLSCTIILCIDMLMSIKWTFFCFLIAATIYSYRCGLHSMWFQSSWQKLPQKAWMGLARRDLNGKKVRSTNLCNLKFDEFSDLMLLFFFELRRRAACHFIKIEKKNNNGNKGKSQHPPTQTNANSTL